MWVGISGHHLYTFIVLRKTLEGSWISGGLCTLCTPQFWKIVVITFVYFAKMLVLDLSGTNHSSKRPRFWFLWGISLKNWTSGTWGRFMSSYLWISWSRTFMFSSMHWLPGRSAFVCWHPRSWSLEFLFGSALVLCCVWPECCRSFLPFRGNFSFVSVSGTCLHFLWRFCPFGGVYGQKLNGKGKNVWRPIGF